ncbi:MAG TPA: hypothetical protein VGG06_07745 [Thermoanaerobaculia bacterium]|jgi:hypothetical protein
MRYDDLEQRYREALDFYRDKSYVTGVDVGVRRRGEDAGKLAVRLHVTKDVDHQVLLAECPDEMLDEVVGGSTEVVQASPCCRFGVPDALRQRKLEHGSMDSTPASSSGSAIQPGMSISRTQGGGGTLGLVAWDAEPGDGGRRQALVSCWHVLAFPRARWSQNLRIVLPAADDDPDNVAYNWVATLSSLDRLRQPGPEGDCAFAYVMDDVLNGRPVRSAQLGTGVEITAAHQVTYEDVESRRRVTKVGWSTGETHGVLDGVGTYFLSYDEPVGRVGIEGFRVVPEPDEGHVDVSKPGDSGACWYLDPRGERSTEKLGVGIHFEGDPAGPEPFALACHLPRALAALKLSLTPPC